MAFDNIAIVNTSLLPTSMEKKNGLAFSRVVGQEKNFNMNSSSSSTQVETQFQYFSPLKPVSTFASKQENINLRLNKASTKEAFISDEWKKWSLFSARTAYSNIGETHFGLVDIHTSMDTTSVRDALNVTSTIEILHGMSIVNNNKEKTTFEKSLPEISARSTFSPESFNFISANTHVYDETNTVGFYNEAKLQSQSIIVESSKPINIGGSSTGGGLRNFTIVVQKMSFFEMTLAFEGRRVVKVTSLPEGLIYDQGKIKGSPKLSGYFPIIIQLDNSAIIEGVVIVPHVQRQL